MRTGSAIVGKIVKVRDMASGTRARRKAVKAMRCQAGRGFMSRASMVCERGRRPSGRSGGIVSELSLRGAQRRDALQGVFQLRETYLRLAGQASRDESGMLGAG